MGTSADRPGDHGHANCRPLPGAGAESVDADAGGLWMTGEWHYRQVMDRSPAAVVVQEAGRVLYVNPAGVRCLAADSQDRIVGRMMTEFIHPAYVPQILARDAAMQHDGDTSPSTEAAILRVDGVAVDVVAVSSRIRWEGRPSVQVVFQPVSRRAAREMVLRHEEALVNHVGDAIIATTATGIVTSWNPAAAKMFRRSAAGALGLPLSDAVGAPLDPAAIVGSGGVGLTSHCASDGSPLAVRVSVAATDTGFALVCTDVSEMLRTGRSFQTVVATLDAGVIVIASDGRIEAANPAAERIIGTGLADLLVAHNVDRATDVPMFDTDGNSVPMEQNPIRQTLLTGVPQSGTTFGFDRVDGQRVWVLGSCRLLEPDDPQHSAAIATIYDVTDQHLANQRFAYEATHDSLTGLPNRAHIVSRISRSLEFASDSVLAAVLFVDLDDLKTINDTLGHHVGDGVLQITARLLRQAARRQDIVGRFGGDEFVILLVGHLTRDDVDLLVGRLHAALDEPVAVDGTTLRIQVSIGVVLINGDEYLAAAQILRDADRAMYQAKKHGPGRTHYFTA